MVRGLCVLFATVAFAASAHGDMRDLVKKSDDYEIHGMAFASAAAELIKSGLCTKSDFYEWGGFTKSTQHKKKPDLFYILWRISNPKSGPFKCKYRKDS